jgi:hypothetical protein
VLTTPEDFLNSIVSMLDPDPTVKPLILAPEFPPDVRHYLKRIQRQSDETIAGLVQRYLAMQPSIPDMPRIGALTAEDATAVELLPAFSETVDKNWNGLKDRAARCKLHEDDAGNPYVPRWVSKTEDKLSPWLSEMGAISDTAKETLTQLCRDAAPAKNDRWANLLKITPTDDMLFLEDVCEAVYHNHEAFVWDLGEGPEPDWRWSTALSLLAGLGTTAVRRVLSGILNEEDLDFWVNCTEEELSRDILKCQQISGYPIGLFRCEWPKVQHALGAEVFSRKTGTYAPKALIAGMLLHIYKHCRVAYGSETKHLIIAHKGSHGVYPLGGEQVDQPFFSNMNKGICKDLCYMLQIPFPSGKADTWVTHAAQTIFGSLKPSMLCRSRSLGDKCLYIPGPTTATIRIKERRSATKWVNTGIAIKHVAKMDLDTGVVDKDFLVTGADTIMYDWPVTDAGMDLMRNWISQLPDVVKPEPGADVILRRVKNVNDLGEPDGYRALINAVLTADLARRDLAGSEIGGLLTQEYPLLYVLPMGHTMEDTTNQGKTNFGRIIGRAMVPAITVTKMNMSSSAPAQRTVAVPLEIYGTAIFDEFQIPPDASHFLDSGGIQALATGTSVSPGKASENHPGIWLKHPLVLVCKVAVAPEDIINRSVPTFMDKLTTETRAVGKALNELMTSTAGMLVRLAHLLWMRKNNIVEKLARVEQTSAATWRFDGHYTIARQFGSVESIDRYLSKARDQMRRQHTEAERSGLVDQVGMSTRFDPKWYFSACSDDKLQMLMMTSTGEKVGHLTPDSALRQLVEDGNTRRFDAILSQFRIREFTANQAFINALLKEKWIKPGWSLTYVSKENSKIRRGGSPVSYVLVERHTEVNPDDTTVG